MDSALVKFRDRGEDVVCDVYALRLPHTHLFDLGVKQRKKRDRKKC